MSPVRSFASGGEWRTLSGAALNTTPPSAPTIISTDYDNTDLAVTLGSPFSDGGSTITGYTVQAVPDGNGVTQAASASGTTVLLRSLVPGVTYTLTAYATNAQGDGTVVTGSFQAPAATFVKPLAYNSGYPHGLPGDTRTPVTLTPITAAALETLLDGLAEGATVASYDIQGGFTLRKDDITFQNCRFSGIPATNSEAGIPFITAGGSIQPTTVTFIDCEFAGNGVEQNDPDGDLSLGWAHSSPSNLVTQIHIRSDIWGFIDGLHATSGSRYESCYVHNLTHFYGPVDDTHNDGFQFIEAAAGFSMVGCNIDLAGIEGGNAVMQYNAGTPGMIRKPLTLMFNWFSGGGFYSFSGEPHLADEDFSMVMAYNRFALQMSTAALWYSDSEWTPAFQQGKLTLIQNVWDATGVNSYGQSVTEGSLIPNP